MHQAVPLNMSRHHHHAARVARVRVTVSVVMHAVLVLAMVASMMLWVVERTGRQREASAFAEALDAAEAGRWYWDLTTDELRWDDRMFQLFGKSKLKWGSDYKSFESTIHPDDIDFVHAELSACITERRGFQAIFRAITDSGETRYILASGKVSRDGKYMTGINVRTHPTETGIQRGFTGHGPTINSLIRQWVPLGLL